MKEIPEKIASRLKELEVRVSDLKNTDRWREWLKFSAKLHRYSWTNSMLIHLQCPVARLVMGYGNKAGTTGWKSVGRQVSKGARGIGIFAPRLVKDDDGGQELAGFHVVYVFDISQTEGDPIPEEPDWPTPTVCPDGLFEKIRTELNHTSPGFPGLSVVSKQDDQMDGARGYLNRKDQEIIVLDAGEPQMVSTLLHELGHYFDPFLQDTPGEYRRHRADCELVAESVMWLASQKAGIDSDDEVEHYLASWSGKDNDLLKLSQRIQASFYKVDPILEGAMQ